LCVRSGGRRPPCRQRYFGEDERDGGVLRTAQSGMGVLQEYAVAAALQVASQSLHVRRRRAGLIRISRAASAVPVSKVGRPARPSARPAQGFARPAWSPCRVARPLQCDAPPLDLAETSGKALRPAAAERLEIWWYDSSGLTGRLRSFAASAGRAGEPP